jgi:hypothetical protein
MEMIGYQQNFFTMTTTLKQKKRTFSTSTLAELPVVEIKKQKQVTVKEKFSRDARKCKKKRLEWQQQHEKEETNCDSKATTSTINTNLVFNTSQVLYSLYY